MIEKKKKGAISLARYKDIERYCSIEGEGFVYTKTEWKSYPFVDETSIAARSRGKL